MSAKYDDSNSKVSASRTSPASMDTLPIVTQDSGGAHSTLSTKELSSQDLEELTIFSRQRLDIEQKIAIVKAWTELDAFKEVSTYSANEDAIRLNREQLGALDRDLKTSQLQREQMDAAIQRFNVQNMTRLRIVAKETSKRHLSATDTDLIEVALDTVYALDKLLRLLRTHRSKHDLCEVRLRWEEMLCSCWEDLIALRQDTTAFESKCERLANTQPEKESMDTSLDSSGDSVMRRSEHSATAGHKELRHKRSASSWRFAAEAIKLESARLAIRIESFKTEKVLPTGRILDLLIDQTQIPEKLIDEQERLEEAVPSASEIEQLAMRLATSLQRNVENAASPTKQYFKASNDQARTPSTQTRQLSSEDSGCRGEGVDELVDKKQGTALPALPDGVAVEADKVTQHTGKGCLSVTGTESSQARTSPGRQNRYRADPENKLDTAIGKIVNDMAVKVTMSRAEPRGVSGSTPDDFTNRSGRYWIGHPEPRLCFCRVLKSDTVMVRVGGGWQELSCFITQHYAHLMDATPRIRAPLRPLLSSPSKSGMPWIRAASGPADPSVIAQHRSGATPRSTRVVTMPVSSSPNTLTPDAFRKSQQHATNLSRSAAHGTDVVWSDLYTSLPQSHSNSSIVLKDGT